MKSKQKIIATTALGVALAVSTALLFVQAIPTDTSATNGLYNGAFSVYAEEQDTATIGQTLGMKSVDGNYLLIATSFDVDDVANYAEVGYKISKNGAEAEKAGAGNQFYTGIVVKTGETTTKEYTLGDNIFADVVADGMIVAEIEYDATADYVIQPYLISNGGAETFVDVNVQHAHDLSVAVTAQPTSNKIASYGKLNTAGMAVTQTCAHCNFEKDVTADCTQDKYTTGNTVTFDYQGEKLTVAVEEVKGYEVKVQVHSGQAVGTGSEYNMNKMPETVPADEYKSTGYVGGTTTANNKFKIHNESVYYQGEYKGQTLYKVGNFDAAETLIYFVWSDVAGYAEISVLATGQANGTMGVTVSSIDLKGRFGITVNGENVAISDNAKTKEFVSETKWAMDFSSVVLASAPVVAGWNAVTILPVKNQAQPNLSTMFFNFIQKLETQSVIPTKEMNTNFRLEPTPELLAGQESTGAIFVAGKLADKTAIAQEGAYVAVKSTIKGSVVTYYVYMEKDVVADVKLTGSSAAAYKTSDATYSGSTPNAVRAVTFGTDVSVAVNGANQALDGAEIPEYIMGLDAGAWSVCQHYVTVDLLQDVELKAGWNTITFTFNTDNCANLAELQFIWPAD